ncbi:hypothetical protein AK88_00312 [Plasmodium fragile]|uniref:Uncharacterized protein n=1 Tax=Plasmodium fragile TaxID=5857 RepID=A0A0D9QT67_PLAFR|nr:uncharacterized protein AK88_00312 [Plasmodium fragile]KJP90143.1 hypothetical protein AK88_00312 [Plasmodium fragile]
MSSYSNYTNNLDEDKNGSAASTSSGKNCLMKGTLSSLKSLIKIFGVTAVLLALHYSNNNDYGINGKDIVSGLKSSNVRSLSEMNANFGESRENLQFSGENVNERRNSYNNGNYRNQWGSYEHLNSSPYSDNYYNQGTQQIGEGSMGRMHFNSFNSGLAQKLKENAIYILPGMIAGYYAWNSLGTQTFILLSAIVADDSKINGGLFIERQEYQGSRYENDNDEEKVERMLKVE